MRAFFVNIDQLSLYIVCCCFMCRAPPPLAAALEKLTSVRDNCGPAREINLAELELTPHWIGLKTRLQIGAQRGAALLLIVNTEVCWHMSSSRVVRYIEAHRDYNL